MCTPRSRHPTPHPQLALAATHSRRSSTWPLTQRASRPISRNISSLSRASHWRPRSRASSREPYQHSIVPFVAKHLRTVSDSSSDARSRAQSLAPLQPPISFSRSSPARNGSTLTVSSIMCRGSAAASSRPSPRNCHCQHCAASPRPYPRRSRRG